MIRLDVRNSNLKRNIAHKELDSEIIGLFLQISVFRTFGVSTSKMSCGQLTSCMVES